MPRRHKVFQLKFEPFVYIHEDEVGFGVPTLYVDDLLLLGANQLLLNKLNKQVRDRFEMADMGDVPKVIVKREQSLLLIQGNVRRT